MKIVFSLIIVSPHFLNVAWFLSFRALFNSSKLFPVCNDFKQINSINDIFVILLLGIYYIYCNIFFNMKIKKSSPWIAKRWFKIVRTRSFLWFFVSWSFFFADECFLFCNDYSPFCFFTYFAFTHNLIPPFIFFVIILVFYFFSLFIIKYIIGKIQHVLNINIHINRANCSLFHDLYNVIHFNTISRIAKQLMIIIGVDPCIDIVFRNKIGVIVGILRILFN